MLKNFLVIALRNLSRHKGYTLLNISGLALGIACSVLIFLLLDFHLNVDGFHKNADRICRVYTRMHFDQTTTTPGVQNPFGKAFKTDFPEVKAASNVRFRSNILISVGGQNGTAPEKFKEEKTVALVEPSYFQIFDCQWVKGSPELLSEPFTAALTEKAARRFFGEGNPIGKTFLYNNWKEVKVVGLLADTRADTDFRREIFVSYATYLASAADDKEHWNGVSSNNQFFLALPGGTSREKLQAQLADFPKRHIQLNPEKYEYVVQPLSDFHFNTKLGGIAPKKVIWALALVGFFLLLTACINFVNLATAQALSRAKEIGIRKTIGSSRGGVFAQFMAETFLIVLGATLLGIFLAKIALPEVRTLTQTDIFLKMTDGKMLFFLSGLALLTTFLAGAYPSLVVAGFQPVAAIKGGLNTRSLGGFNVRRALVVAQFAICQLLIIAALVMGGQMDFIRTADLGFNPEAVVNLPLPNSERTKMQSLRAQFGQIPGVLGISFNEDSPASNNFNTSNSQFDNRGTDEPWMISTKAADDQYLQIFDLKLAAGRNVLPADSLRETLLNEAAVKKLGLSSPEEAVGKRFQIWGTWTTVAGVVKDFHAQSLQEGIEPMVIVPEPGAFSSISLKIDLDRKDAVLKSAEGIWNSAFPQHFFEHEFSDETVANFYKMEGVLLKLVRFFCGVAIFIACLGLYGLVSFLALRKQKEIGIRKVLGASVLGILGIFGREFGVLMLIGFVLAAPVGYLSMNGWLNDYVFRIPLGAGIFLSTIGFTALVALITVAWQSLRAAVANPASSLKSD